MERWKFPESFDQFGKPQHWDGLPISEQLTFHHRHGKTADDPIPGRGNCPYGK